MLFFRHIQICWRPQPIISATIFVMNNAISNDVVLLHINALFTTNRETSHANIIAQCYLKKSKTFCLIFWLELCFHHEQSLLVVGNWFIEVNQYSLQWYVGSVPNKNDWLAQLPSPPSTPPSHPSTTIVHLPPNACPQPMAPMPHPRKAKPCASQRLCSLRESRFKGLREHHGTVLAINKVLANVLNRYWIGIWIGMDWVGGGKREEWIERGGINTAVISSLPAHFVA